MNQLQGGGSPENGDSPRRSLFWIDPAAVYSAPQLAGLLGLKRTTVQGWCRDGLLPVTRTRGNMGHFRILGHDALRFLRAREALPLPDIKADEWYPADYVASLLKGDTQLLSDLNERGRKDYSLGLRRNTIVRGASHDAYLAGQHFEQIGDVWYYGGEILRFWSLFFRACCN